MTRLAVLVVLAGAGIGAGAGAARADATAPAARVPIEPRQTIAILDIRAPSTDVEKSFETNLEAQLDNKHYWLVSRARVRERLRNSTKWTEGCIAGACLAELKVQAQADVALLAALIGSGTSFGYVVTLVRTDTGHVLAQEADRCDVCTLDEAMRNATLATIKLVNAMPGRFPDEAAERRQAIATAVAPVERRLAEQRRGARGLGAKLAITGAVLAAAGTALYLAQDSRPGYALGAATAGGGLLVGGLAIFTF